MTNHSALYQHAVANLATITNGRFRLTDLVDNPPANLGRKFRNAVVVHKRFPNIRRVGADSQSIIYEKFQEESC